MTFAQCGLEKIGDSQLVSPLVQIRDVQTRPLLSDDTEHVSPLPVRHLSAPPIPTQLAEDDVLRRGHGELCELPPLKPLRAEGKEIDRFAAENRSFLMPAPSNL